MKIKFLYKLRNFTLLIAAGLICLFFRFPAFASTPALEYQVKASFLFNFIKFIEWPAESFASAEDSITISVIGENVFGSSLDAIAKEEVNGRPIKIKYCKQASEIMPCHVLFCTNEKSSDKIGNILEHPNSGILTIGQRPGFAKSGGVINFVIMDDKVRFEINQAAAKSSNLTISSQLLKLATKVYEDDHSQR